MAFRPQPISGFPEWLPQHRLVEQAWIDRIRTGFESYGFTNIETPAAEVIDVLLAKGETDKEIYTINRLQADPEDSKEARLALHFDLTVPFARYVGQYFNELSFPFKRYQIQKVWRGERPQDGRFREFYQCDIDVIGIDSLPLHFDAEMPSIIMGIIDALPVDPVRLHVSNRKILTGYLKGLGFADQTIAVRILDKVDKIGAEACAAQLVAQTGCDPETAARALGLVVIKTPDDGFAEQVRALGVKDELLETGLTELAYVMRTMECRPGSVLADLSIARGFDYYTGTVYEGRFIDHPGFGSVCGGGRYDDLAGQFINKRLPGIGLTIGLTRIFSKMLASGKLDARRACPTEVLVVWPSEDARPQAAAAAEALRRRGIRTELYHAPSKLQKQIGYADKKGIPFVWFPPFEAGQNHEVKVLSTGEQFVADPEQWKP